MRMTVLEEVKDFIQGYRDYEPKSPLRKKRPSFCDILISEKCNFKCKKCYFWKAGLESSLSFEDCKNVVNTLSKIGARPFEINLGGGEPLLNKWIIDLIKYCVKKGLRPVMSTNAALIDKKMAKRLAASGLHRLSVSLDSLNEDVQDTITGVKGSFAKTMKGLEHLAEYWKHGELNIHTVLSSYNIDHVVDLVEWVNKHEGIDHINIQALAQPFRTEIIDEWHHNEEYRHLWPKDIKRVHEVLDQIMELKKKHYKIVNPLHQFKVYKVYYEHPERFARKFRCNFGDYSINVNVLGLVHLCCFMDPLGSIRETSLEKIWFSQDAETMRTDMYNCRKSCNNILNCFFQEEGVDLNPAGLIKEAEAKGGSDVVSVENMVIEEIPPAKPELNFCTFIITPECDLPCKMCHMWKDGDFKKLYKENTLTIGEWKWLIDGLMDFKGHDRLTLNFTGGEPLMKRGTLELIKYAHERELHTMLGTSGHLIDNHMARQIIKSGVDFINISIDSADAKLHDYMRGKKGVYKRVMKAVERLHTLKPSLELQALCLLSKPNLNDVLSLVDMIERDERFSGIYFQAVVQPFGTAQCNYWYRFKEYSFLWPGDTPEMHDVLNELIARKRAGGSKIGNRPEQLEVYKEYFKNPEEVNKHKRCLRESNSITVNWQGSVNYCEYLGPIGNVKEIEFKHLLTSTVSRLRRAEMSRCERQCNYIENIELKKDQIRE